MYPWFWLWAPRFQFPFSGALSQWVEPNTSWFFGAIPPQAGNGALEQKIFDIASYGRQIGLITEVLLSTQKSATVDAAKGAESLARLEKLYGEIEDMKSVNETQVVATTLALLTKLRATNAKEFALALEQLQSGAA